MIKHRISGAWFVAAAAVLWSTGGVSIKWLDLPTPAIIGGRTLMSSLFFFTLLGWRLRPMGDRRFLVLGALSYVSTVGLFVAATRMTTAANAIILQFTFPAWVALLGWLLLGEKPTVRDLLIFALAASGLVLCMSESLGSLFSGVLTRRSIGDLLALGSGLGFAGLTLCMRRSRTVQSAHSPTRMNLEILAFGSATAALACLPFLGAQVVQGQVGVAQWAVFVWMGAFQLGLAYVLFQHGLGRTTAMRAANVCLLEPILNPVWVWLLIGEQPTVATLTGGAIVLSVLILSAIPIRTRRMAPEF